MNDYILAFVKKKLDIAYDESGSMQDTFFDERLLIDIEDAIGELSQLIKIDMSNRVHPGISMHEIMPYYNNDVISLCKQFISISVRLSFDPPSGSVLTSLERSRDRIASRITMSIQKSEDEENDK